MFNLKKYFSILSGLATLLIAISPINGAASEICRFNKVCLKGRSENGIVRMDLHTSSDQELTVFFRITQSGLAGPEVDIQHHVVSKPGVQPVFESSILKSNSWKFEVGLTIHPGVRTYEHWDGTIYRIPFHSGETVRVLQGYNSTSTHGGPYAYSIDFEAPIGTEFLAARSGQVIAVRDDSIRGGPHPNFDNDTNYIWIRHEDGTIGQYLHLNTNGVYVTKGQKVQQGDPLGQTGNTGLSYKPHLHFNVSTSLPEGSNAALKTFPTYFKTESGFQYLEEGEVYIVP